jgi:tight adherence protein B
MTLILWIGGGIAVLLLAAGVIVTVTTERSLVEERLERYLEEPGLEFGDDSAEDATTPVTDWINDLVSRSSFGDRVAADLAQADLKIRAGEYVGLMIISAFITGLIGYFFGRSSTLFAIIGFFFGLYIPRFFVRRQQKTRLVNFDGQLGDMLNLMVNGLRAGFSTMQAMESVSKEMPPPIKDEFRRVIQEMQLGVSMEDALDNLLRRIPSADLDLTITAINVQREVGGNLAEILDTISHTIRERVRIKGEIVTLTAQVLYSGRFLAILPMIMSLILFAVNRDYMMSLFEEPILCGIVIVIIATIMIISGWIVMNKIGDIEV